MPEELNGKTRPELTPVWRKLSEVFEDVFDHTGFGKIEISLRWLAKGRKEVIISSGKEYRFIVVPGKAPGSEENGVE